LEFLDIDHSTWSLIIFFTQIILTFSIVLFLIAGSFKSFALLLFVWITSQLAFLLYGVLKGLIGFILLFVFNILITLVTIVINTEKETENEDE
jgi:hypothetical protein